MRNRRYLKVQLWFGVASIILLLVAAHAHAQLPVSTGEKRMGQGDEYE